jgi:hypothetical protein
MYYEFFKDFIKDNYEFRKGEKYPIYSSPKSFIILKPLDTGKQVFCFLRKELEKSAKRIN